MDILDNPQVLSQRDPQNALSIALNQCDYFSVSFDADFEPTAPIENIVWAGMGGSALPMVVVQSWPRLNIPFEVVRNYMIPPYVGEKTLFVASSYSGNTEETLEALSHAEAAGAQIVVVAAGGKLAEIASEKGYPHFAIPGGIQPRMATFYFVSAFLAIVRPLGATVEDVSELASVGGWLREQLGAFGAETPTSENYAKQLATKLVGKTTVTYAGPLLFPAANKLKICMNENAKNTAWTNQYPEFNHNEFIGWSSHPTEKPFAVVEFRSNLEHERVQKRFEVSERLLSGLRPSPIVIEPKGDTLLQQLAYSFALADFVSIYVAILNGVNPTPVELVEKLKVELG